MPTKVIEPLNLDPVLGKTWNRVAKLGVELEGGWTKSVPNPLPKGYKFEGDGSVFGAGTTIQNHTNYGKMVKKGELSTPPIFPAQMPLAVKRFYPDLVDRTCGMHVHMSFWNTYQYTVLADSPVYQETVLHYLLKWANNEGFAASHHIWKRLKGENQYCTKGFWPYSQITKSTKDYGHEGDHRYTAISYQWERYKTVECRVLPMMETPEQAIRAIKELLAITNAYLVLCEKVRIKAGGKIELPSGDEYSETFEIRL